MDRYRWLGQAAREAGTTASMNTSQAAQLSDESLIVPSLPSQDPEEEELALSSLHIPDTRVQGHREQLSQTRDPGKG